MDEAIAALPRVMALDRQKVRQRFEQRFSATRMAKDYVGVYRSLLASSAYRRRRRARTSRSLAGRARMQHARGRTLLRQDSTATLVEEVPEAPFYIPATGSSDAAAPHAQARRLLRRARQPWRHRRDAGGPDGIFFHDTRYLSHLELLLNGKQPLLLGSNVRDDNSILTVDLTNPDIYLDQKLVLPKDMLHIVRTLFLWRGTAYQRLRMQNHGDRPFDVRLSLRLRQRLRRLFEVRGHAPRAPRHRDARSRRRQRRSR